MPDALPVVIVGASMGGLRTAEALRRAGYSGPVTVIGEELHAPYNRPPLSKDVLSTGVSHEAVAFPARAATADVTWMLGARAISADLEARTVTTDDGREHPWRALVIATGLRARRLDLPLIAGRHCVRTLDDAMALRDELVPGARVVVVGAGFIGCEVAATARKLGCEVTIVAPGADPLIRPLGAELGAELRRRHEAHGVSFQLGRTVAAMLGESAFEGLQLDDGTIVPGDVLVEAIGSECNTHWLDATDLDLTDGVLADAALRAVSTDGTVSHDVFVVGDIARFPNLLFDGVARRVEHWNIPTDTGKRAGAVLGAGLAADGSFDEVVAKGFTPMPAFWSNQFEMSLQAYGLPGLGAGDIRILEGELSGAVAVGYYRAERLVGVVGLGLKAELLPYRQEIAAHAAS
ncbi:oxidoreductase [Glaciihabitans sp. INWT7]|uniref:NAD(P)/FAD-dependent oxidoreductase n=1 Tax=Glaciihabitans sp. INWT7 TaxID=2596912 RepID=UPI0016299EE7|nr:FAD-dependent oxidoreductase [Glaciihabitans sp. INWT7]QNE46244.1 oxidoreductase [Glaciihabitans sp. INWT7]